MTPTARPRTIGIAGAGPAGLAAALAFARQGREVVVHERFVAPGDRLGAAARPAPLTGRPVAPTLPASFRGG